MTHKYILILTNRETGERRELSFDSAEARAVHLPDVHKFRYQFLDPEETDSVPVTVPAAGVSGQPAG